MKMCVSVCVCVCFETVVDVEEWRMVDVNSEMGRQSEGKGGQKRDRG